MMDIAEDPTGYLLTLFPLVFNCRKVVEDNMLDAGQFVVLPLDLWPVDAFGC